MVQLVGSDFAVARAGDERAFAALLRPLVLPAYELAYAMLRDRAAAEDVVQEAATQAWRRLGQLRGDENALRPWLFAIVANGCRAQVRQRWWRVVRRPDLETMATGVTENNLAEGADLRSAWARLRPEERAALFLHYCQDLTAVEVARSLRLSESAAKARIQRALVRLRTLMKEEFRDG